MAGGAGGGVGEPVAGQAWQGAGEAGGQGGAGGDGQVQGQELCTAGFRRRIVQCLVNTFTLLSKRHNKK